jgi:hypothetical protein
MGMANTNQIYARLTTAGGVSTANYAAGIAWSYENNSKTDWFLPSKDELNELCKYAKTQTTGVTGTVCAVSDPLLTGFAEGPYWSSSETVGYDYDTWLEIPKSAWDQNFRYGYQYDRNKNYQMLNRPVRAG